MTRARRTACLAWVAAGIAAGTGNLAGQDALPTRWDIVPAQSRVTISVFPAGLLSGALHTHLFRPASWSGRIAAGGDDPANVRVEVRFAADSLKDFQEKLSAADIAKVEAQVRSPRILDASRFPEITFEGRQLQDAQLPAGGSGEFRATLSGTLTLHGVAKPLRFPIRGKVTESRLEAGGTVTFKQSDFGIKPYSTALGSIAVKDEVKVEIELVALPAASR
jgi:polyisoprenoid-binding protein YceI